MAGGLAGGVHWGDEGEIGGVRVVSSSAALRSSSLHCCFLVLFAGGGTDGDESWTAIGGDVG
jgi:hypothetical protein